MHAEMSILSEGQIVASSTFYHKEGRTNPGRPLLVLKTTQVTPDNTALTHILGFWKRKVLCSQSRLWGKWPCCQDPKSVDPSPLDTTVVGKTPCGVYGKTIGESQAGPRTLGQSHSISSRESCALLKTTSGLILCTDRGTEPDHKAPSDWELVSIRAAKHSSALS